MPGNAISERTRCRKWFQKQKHFQKIFVGSGFVEAYNRASLAVRAILDAWGAASGRPDPSLAEAVARAGATLINTGIYILEPDTFDRIPKGQPWSIERSFFPSLIERNETFVAYVYRGYWIDIGTPEKYTAVHRDIMDGRDPRPPAGWEGGSKPSDPPPSAMEITNNATPTLLTPISLRPVFMALPSFPDQLADHAIALEDLGL